MQNIPCACWFKTNDEGDSEVVYSRAPNTRTRDPHGYARRLDSLHCSSLFTNPVELFWEIQNKHIYAYLSVAMDLQVHVLQLSIVIDTMISWYDPEHDTT